MNNPSSHFQMLAHRANTKLYVRPQTMYEFPSYNMASMILIITNSNYMKSL